MKQMLPRLAKLSTPEYGCKIIRGFLIAKTIQLSSVDFVRIDLKFNFTLLIAAVETLKDIN